MLRVILGGVFLSFALYITVGVFGYLSFGPAIKDNILLNYSTDSKANPEVLIGKLMICSAVILGYPMSSWVMRNSFEQIYFYYKAKRARYQKLDREDTDTLVTQTVSWRQNLLETAVILGVSVIIAMAIPQINTVFGLVGSTSSVTLNFIVPGLMYIKLLKKHPSKGSPVKRVGAMTLVVFGVVVGIVGTATTIIGLVD